MHLDLAQQWWCGFLRALQIPLLAAGLCAVTPAAAHASPAVQVAEDDVTLVKKGRESDSGGGSGDGLIVLKGDLAWLVAGGLGALVPLVLFALPFIWGPLGGPFYAPFFVVALIWGTLMVTAGGATAWLISALFSDMQSGFLIPVAAAAVVGLVGILVSGLAALVLFLPFYIAGSFYSRDVFYSPYYAQRYYYNPFAGAGTVLAFAVWAVGITATSIAGPVLAAWLYRRLGVPRNGRPFKFSLTTGDDVEAELQKLKIDTGDEDGDSGSSNGSGKSRAKAPSSDGQARNGDDQPRSSKSASSKGPKTGPKSKVVGAACSTSSECAGMCSNASEFGGGMCTQACESSRTCPVDSACVDVAGGACAVSCTSDAQCEGFQQGFVCRSVNQAGGGNARVCLEP